MDIWFFFFVVVLIIEWVLPKNKKTKTSIHIIPSILFNVIVIVFSSCNCCMEWQTLSQGAFQDQYLAAEAMYNLASNQQKVGDYPASIRSFRKCLCINPRHGPAAYSLAVLYEVITLIYFFNPISHRFPLGTFCVSSFSFLFYWIWFHAPLRFDIAIKDACDSSLEDIFLFSSMLSTMTVSYLIFSPNFNCRIVNNMKKLFRFIRKYWILHRITLLPRVLSLVDLFKWIRYQT